MNFCRNKYRLELRWESLNYESLSVCRVEGAYFTGPALKIANRIVAPDKIALDLTPQMINLISNYYIVNLTWEGVEYTSDGNARLLGAALHCLDIADVHKFKDDDYVVIDTQPHEEEQHPYNLVYKSQTVRGDNKVYDYGDK